MAIEHFIVAGVFAMTLACEGNAGSDCPTGSPGCACAAGTCEAGLICEDLVCVFAGGETGQSEDSGETASSEPGGPVVQELFTIEPALREDRMVTFTAQVSDPDGLADIVGGVLLDDENGANYGPFVQISEGSFSAVVTWGQVNDARRIRFEGSGSRVYRAEFTDTSQNKGSRTIDIPFACDTANAAVCGDAECRELGTRSDCEGCNDECRYHACEGGVCPDGEFNPCFATAAWPADATCDDICAQGGYEQCVLGCRVHYMGSGTSVTFIAYETLADCESDPESDPRPPVILGACDIPFGQASPYPVARCCCGPV